MDIPSRKFDWLYQAQDDFDWAKDTLKIGRFAQACFVAQQSAEKALKALALHMGFDITKSHSVMQIATALKLDPEIYSAGKILDRYYIAGRYPDAFPAGFPSQLFNQKDADDAIEQARIVLSKVQTEINK